MKRFILIILTVTALSFPAYSMDDVYGWNFIIGLKGGFSHVVGKYETDFSGSEYLGLYIIPYAGKYFMAEVDAGYSRYPLGNSPGAKLLAISCGIGPVFTYPLIDHLHLFAGLSFQGTYVRLDPTSIINSRKVSYKIGFSAKAGFIIPISWGIEARLGCDYSFMTLSNKPFHSLHYSLGITYNYNVYAYTRKSGGRIPIDPEAEERRKKEEERKRKLRESALLELEKARELIGNGEYYQSIDHIKEAMKVLPEAEEELKLVRQKLVPEVLRLEKAGIAAYESKNYKKCIAIMKKIQHIDPENRVMKIYLPRAVKRYNALQKLR